MAGQYVTAHSTVERPPVCHEFPRLTVDALVVVVSRASDVVATSVAGANDFDRVTVVAVDIQYFSIARHRTQR